MRPRAEHGRPGDSAAVRPMCPGRTHGPLRPGEVRDALELSENLSPERSELKGWACHHRSGMYHVYAASGTFSYEGENGSSQS
jgi:hypothetical protein